MADPGFPRRRGQPLSLEQKPIILQDLYRKLHENERNWTERGRAFLAPPLDPPIISAKLTKQNIYRSLVVISQISLPIVLFVDIF